MCKEDSGRPEGTIQEGCAEVPWGSSKINACIPLKFSKFEILDSGKLCCSVSTYNLSLRKELYYHAPEGLFKRTQALGGALSTLPYWGLHFLWIAGSSPHNEGLTSVDFTGFFELTNPCKSLYEKADASFHVNQHSILSTSSISL